jgi:hypothetical protein
MNTQNLRLVEDPLAPEAPPPDPLIGRVLEGRYLIEKVLGEGGMGVVYRAKHTMLGKSLAVKVLRAEVSKDSEIVQRFRQEAQSATEIGNEHIIDISDFGTMPDGATYFVMEYLDGIAITKALEIERPISAARTVRIAKQICTALGAAHSANIVHRDLKPDNIYLVKRSNDTDFVKVLDFGIAKVGGATSKLTRAGAVFGTPHYMSPEQCAGTEVDQRTDIYALGIILYEMVTGRVPFDADNLMGILTKHLYEKPLAPRELLPTSEIPPALESVIMKALEKNREQRYQTMQEMREDLERIEQGLVPTAVTDASERAAAGALAPAPFANTQRSPAGAVAPAEDPPQKSSSKLPLLLGGALLLVLVGGGVAAVAFRGNGDPPPSAAQPTPPPVVPPPVVPVPTAPPQPTPDPVAAQPAQPAPGPVRVTITSEPPGAAVFVNEALVGNTPFEMARPEGDTTTTLTLRLPEHVEQAVTLSALTQPSVRIQLERARRSGGGSRRPSGSGGGGEAAPVQAQPRPSGGGSEVLNPWDN